MSEKLKSFVEIYGAQKDATDKDNWNLLFGAFCLGWDGSRNKTEADLRNGDYCRYVEHSQGHCGCEEVHEYFKKL